MKLKKKQDGGDPSKQQPSNKPTTADSLALYNNSKQVRDYYLNNPNYHKVGSPINYPASVLFRKNDEGVQLMKNNNYFTMQPGDKNSTKITPDQYRKNIDNNRYYQRELQNLQLDLNAPMSLYDKRISPQFETDYANSKTGDVVNLSQYDPIAVKPWNMLTPDERQQRVQKYGDPTKGVQQSVPPIAERSQVQGPQSATPGIGQIGIPTGGPGPLAGGPTNFSFTGRNDQGQQDTRYFSDLDTWKAATDQMGYRWRSETNNGQQANASGYQFKLGGMTRKDLGGGYSPVGTPLAQVVQPPNTMNMVPHIGPMQQAGQPNSDPNNPGTSINWDHVLASYVAGNLTQGLVSRLSPNSQQNTTQQFNKQQFSPMNFLPYTPNNSIQAQFGTQGMSKGGLVTKEDGGFSTDMSENMRKWILDDDNPQPAEESEEQVQQQVAPSAEFDDVQQFAMFAQMFGLDAADGEREPEQQDQGYMKKGGWLKGAVNPKHKGFCSPMTKSTCTGHRKAFAETMKKHHGFHAMGGLTVDTLYSAGQELDVTPEQYKQMLDQGYQFE